MYCKLMLSDGKQSECEKRLSIKLETQPFRTQADRNALDRIPRDDI